MIAGGLNLDSHLSTEEFNEHNCKYLATNGVQKLHL
jgi:hypothetical protein